MNNNVTSWILPGNRSREEQPFIDLGRQEAEWNLLYHLTICRQILLATATFSLHPDSKISDDINRSDLAGFADGGAHLLTGMLSNR